MTEQEKQIVDTRVVVETPEGVDFTFVIAGPGKRGAAFILDTILMASVVIAIGWLVLIAISSTGAFAGMGTLFVLIAWFAAQWLYRSAFESFWNGQTPAKRILNLRVVRSNGTPIGWFEAFGRNVLLVADAIPGPYTVGLLAMSATPKLQRLGDLFFDTMVIDETREFAGRAPGVTRGVERILRSECSGRYHVPERTLAVIERLFDKDRLVSDARREEIARVLSSTLRKRLGYQEAGPDEANPHPYFQRAPQKHTLVLRRILKTFSDDPDGSKSAREEEDQTRESLNAAVSTVRSSTRSRSRDNDSGTPNPFLLTPDDPTTADSGTKEGRL